jgi:hypothetical protein
MKTRNATAQVAVQSAARAVVQSPAKPLLVFPGGVFPGGAPLKTLQNASGLISRAWRWFRERQSARSNTKRLQLSASLSLGEKRFIAVIQVDGQQFLVGGGATNVSLLAHLVNNDSFGNLLEDTMSTAKKQPAKRARKQIVRPVAEPMGDQE